MRWIAHCAYDGTDFEGWQSQAGGNTVQDFIERRLSFVLGTPTRIHASGRTDSGVHAIGQVFHFDGQWNHPPEALLRALRTGFPKSIQVFHIQETSDVFHARFSAIKKRYVYRLFLGYTSPFYTRFYWSMGQMKLDLPAMQKAAQLLLGTHNFKPFSAERGDEPLEDPVRTLHRLDIEAFPMALHVAAEADGFLYKMVRSLVGTLVEVGRGKLEVQAIEALLHDGKRSAAVVTAPAQGLCLEKVWYPSHLCCQAELLHPSFH